MRRSVAALLLCVPAADAFVPIAEVPDCFTQIPGVPGAE